MSLEALFVLGYKWIYLGIMLAIIGTAGFAVWRDFKIWKRRYQKFPNALRSELKKWAGPQMRDWLRDRFSENKALVWVIVFLLIVLLSLSIILITVPAP